MYTQHEIEQYQQQLDRSGWSLAAILTGSVLLWQAPFGAWLIGVAVILLGTNLIRRVPLSSLTLVLGITALIIGSGFALGINVLLIPLLLIISGGMILFKTLSHSRMID